MLVKQITVDDAEDETVGCATESSDRTRVGEVGRMGNHSYIYIYYLFYSLMFTIKKNFNLIFIN